MKAALRKRDQAIQPGHPEARASHRVPGPPPRALIHKTGRRARTTSSGSPKASPRHHPRSPTHYELSSSVPGPQPLDPQGLQASNGLLAATPAGSPAADCGTAPPCGGRPYGGPAIGLTFSLLGVPEGRRERFLESHPTHLARSFDNKGMERNAEPIAFFTERSLAAYLAVSDRTIRNWIRRGELPSYKLGASRRIDPADVNAFLAQRRDEAA